MGRIQRHGVWRCSPQGTPGCRKSSGLLCQMGEVTESSEQGRPVQGGSWEHLSILWGSLHPTESPRTPLSSPLSSTPPCLCSRSSSMASSTSSGESLSEEELARILEQVEDKKKLIASMRSKPWPMARKLAELR